MSGPILISKLYTRIWCSTMSCETNDKSGQIYTLPRGKATKLKVGSLFFRLWAGNRDGGSCRLRSKRQNGQKGNFATQYSDMCSTEQCKSSKWPT